ncbi:calcineurin-like phosphoesterase family protein [Allonocardiopsis opalescens]|uniref:Calcineurin-like phosphoesterase family protein n=1 Tax=Allonocardiopsis opalescens TaxID=1144618 RepID=A0A2T0QAR3_9ACTN|nr:calcineurin-like phosphoesterase family protein [Allonocardiopsis opalescens]
MIEIIRGARDRVPRRWWVRARVGAKILTIVLVGLVGGWLGLLLGSTTTTPIGPADVNLSLNVNGQGDTVLHVPPLGTLSLDTHTGPISLDVTIDEINPEAAQSLLNEPSYFTTLADRIADDAVAGIVQLLARGFAVATLGAGLAGLIVFRDWRRAGIAAGTALGTLIATGGLAAATFNPASISEPRFSGLLAGAPSLIGSAEDIVDRFDHYSQQLARLVGNVSQLYQVAADLPVYQAEEDTIRVLHVSDIHLNPAAWDVIASLVEQFQIDVVVDSGDLTDHGSEPEDQFADGISDIPVPYIWVRGNHDSANTQEAVAEQDNAIVLDDDTAEVAGLTFYGAGDPRFTPDQQTRNSLPDNAELLALGRQQAVRIAAADPPVDVAIAHDPAQGVGYSGHVPLVLAGHGHNRWTEMLPTGTFLFVQGSTGGAGLRGLDSETGDPTPYQASVLYFDAETRRLQAWDDITLGGYGLNSAQIERHLETDPDRAITPEPVPTPSPSPSPSASEPSPSPSGSAAAEADTENTDPADEPAGAATGE